MVQIRQFFEDGSGRLSMSRLLAFMAYFPAAFVTLATRSVEMAGAILTAYVVQYGLSKFGDVQQTKADKNAPTS